MTDSLLTTLIHETQRSNDIAVITFIAIIVFICIMYVEKEIDKGKKNPEG